MEKPKMQPRKAFFGRRKGKSLRSRQHVLYNTLLSYLRIDLEQNALSNLQSLFAIPVEAIRLEIGFGSGEHLLYEASRFPDVGFIGIEPFVNGMAKILRGFETTPDLFQHIRLYDDDAINLLDWLPDKSIDGIDLFYPDPWVRRKHWKRRFVNMHNLDCCARVLKKGSVFRFVSDVDTYVNWTLLHIRNHTAFSWLAQDKIDWHMPYAAWPGTRYERKAIREGRKPTYLTFIRV